MKLKGLALTLPVCDLRPLVAEKSRRASLSPSLAECGETHIIGFGAAKERKLNLPWREDKDTIYFDCSGAISLPSYLPDGESVERAVRRVYLDSDALVRFEFMLFAPPRHHYSEYYNRADEFARSFWEERVTIKQRRSKTEENFATAIPLLVKKFAAMTTPDFRKGLVRSDLVAELEPQIQVIGEVEGEEHEVLNPQHVFEKTKISVAFRCLKMKGRANRVDTVYITFPPGLYTHPRYTDYEPLSHLRAHLAWLHADLEVLNYILHCCSREKAPLDASLISDYVVKLAKGLRSVPSVGHPQEQLLLELVGVWEKFHQKRMSRLIARIEESGLTKPVKNEITTILRSYLSKVETTKGKSEAENPQRLLCLNLMKDLGAISEGREGANEYHALMIGALETIFSHELHKPKKEQKIHEGRKRVDIVFNNRSQGGFFHDLSVRHKVPCPYVFFECKNYSGDPTNPELDQLIGRLNKKRGLFGALLCRNVNDKQAMLERCQDAIQNNRYVLVLDDSDIKQLLELRASDDFQRIDDYMDDLFRQLVM